MYADVWLTKVAFDACLLPWLIRLIALSYNLRAVNLLQYQYIRLRMSFRNEFFWRGIQNHPPLTRHCNNFSCWRCVSNGFERRFSRTNVSLFDWQNRLPILHGHVRKKKLFSSISLPGLDKDVFLANVTVRIVLPKQMAPLIVGIGQP